MGKEKNKLLDKKLDDVSLEKVSGGSSTHISLHPMDCPRCHTFHEVKGMGYKSVSYKKKWTDGYKFSCDKLDGVDYIFYKVTDGANTIWLDVNFEEIFK